MCLGPCRWQLECLGALARREIAGQTRAQDLCWRLSLVQSSHASLQEFSFTGHFHIVLLSRGGLTTKTKKDKHRYHHFNGLLSQVTNVPWFFSVKLLMVSKIAAAEPLTATGALALPCLF